MTNHKIICSKCKNNVNVRHMQLYKNKYLCHNCYVKENKEKFSYKLFNKGMSLEDALNKERIIKCYGKKSIYGVISLPRCLVGKKVKLILVERKK
jgi:hypothetical protein